MVKTHLSETELYCEQHFQETVKRRDDGRFEVNIPFSDMCTELGDSEEQAQRRFLTMERRLYRDAQLRKDYNEFMDEYQRMGHMVKVSADELNGTNYHCFLPHHPVIKKDSITTKVRVVFDGSAVTSSGLSLNNVQRVGPKVQDDLFEIVVRFRQYNYVITSDIEKMYRQIWINKEQSQLHRVLWRSDRTQPIQIYRLTTVTYGTASAPFLATRCLQQIADDVHDLSSKISKVIKHDFYVDDLLSGAASIEEARRLREDLSSTLADYGFNLRKWASSNQHVLPDEEHNQDVKTITECEEKRTLGIVWNTSSDTLQYSINMIPSQKVTKRTILSSIAHIFDPLGLIGPVTIVARIILQELWQLQVNWDEALPVELHTKWTNFYKDLGEVQKIRIPRHALQDQIYPVQIHGFCDASERAYGACIYLRSVGTDGRVMVKLLCAKAKVAPLRSTSLPRLELCGALLLAQLTKRVTDTLTVPIEEIHYWCDSTITLSWIRGSSHRWKTFVANRTAMIQESTKMEQWKHISSEDNPADLITRGVNPTLIGIRELWWSGPSWLLNDGSCWPTQILSTPAEIPEERQVAHALFIQESERFSLLKRFSSYNRLLRVTAWCLRFKDNALRSTGLKHCSQLSSTELGRALNRLLKIAQNQDFKNDIHNLSLGSELGRHSTLRALHPFLDSQGILRVGGRLRQAALSYDERHQIIIGQKNPLTKLLIQHEHRRLLHAGPQTVLASLRQRYWPIAARSVVRKLIRECVKCFKANPINASHIMGDLPAERVTPSRPFSFTGVDYAGPILVKDGRTRNRILVKAYICVFVCLCTKAFHLEVATDMTSNAFMNCLRRFIARRGRCISITSDNGTNFVGAKHELEELRTLLTDKAHQDAVINFASQEGICWKFIPPRAPHFGGLWERGVRSIKHHLRRTLGDSHVTFEELSTILAQIESCLNSRPLSPLSNSPDDLLPLTPGHFLIGVPLMALPDTDLTHISINRLDRYQHMQQLIQHFWRRWQRDYLQELQRRNKWQQNSRANLNVGTMVIIQEDNIMPLKWSLGRVVEVYPGSDGVVRVASVKTRAGVLKRPITKLCPLSIEE